MSGFFDRMLGRNKETPSANKAKERLQFVLIHDRVNLPPERLKAMKEEILAVISKYVAVSRDEVEIALEQRDRNKNKLIAEIPFSKSLSDDAPSNPRMDEDDDQKPSAYNMPPAPTTEAAKALAAKAMEDEEARDDLSASAKGKTDESEPSESVVDEDKKEKDGGTPSDK
jgi:cell division topological specificity factor